ncbi:MAG: glycosyltransferase family 39 protein [Anaerolineae bacterium]|nr:glycosyltransferase family 39 protein [Anaerolineae bacterium]
MPDARTAITSPRAALALILAAFVLLATVYSVTTPIFEASDELWHYPVIEYMIAHNFALPVQDPDDHGLWEQEGSQPPLYYWLAALVAAPVDHGDMRDRLVENPHGKAGIGLAADNNNIVLHDQDAEAFPWQQTALAVHLVRFFSILLGAGTVWLTYHIARLAVPGRPALHLTAVLIVAFNPMFLFISASANNDNLINLLGAAVMALLLHSWRAGMTTRRLWALAILLALASITKLSGLAFYPLAGLVILLVGIRDHLPPRRLIEVGVIAAAVWVVIGGWWYWRNYDLYDDPTGLNVMVEIAGPRENLPTLSDAWDELKGFRLSYWGLFGAVNVLAPDRFFDYTDALCLLALAGLVFYAVRTIRAVHERPTPGKTSMAARLDRWRDVLPVVFLVIQVIIVFVGVVNWTRRTYASQGRLMFSVIGPLAVLGALGLISLIPRTRWQRFVPALTIPLIAAAVLLPFTTIAPRYAPPDTVSAPPADALPVEARFGPVDLLAVDVDDKPVRPGDSLAITLYWRALDHTDQDLSLYVQVFGLDDPTADEGLQQIAKLDSFPGRGLLRTTTWDLDRVYADTYHLTIDADARTPVQPKLKIGWWDYDTRTVIEPVTFDGNARDPVVIDAGRVVGDGSTLIGGTGPGATFSGVMRLNHSRIAPDTLPPGETLTVALEWEALADIGEDLTILVHLVDPADPDSPIAQGDAPPLVGRWPTSAWVPGSPFVDEHTLTIPPDTPPGEYRLAVGFYRPADLSRLPVETQLDTLPGAAILPHTVTLKVE